MLTADSKSGVHSPDEIHVSLYLKPSDRGYSEFQKAAKRGDKTAIAKRLFARVFETTPDSDSTSPLTKLLVLYFLKTERGETVDAENLFSEHKTEIGDIVAELESEGKI